MQCNLYTTYSLTRSYNLNPYIWTCLLVLVSPIPFFAFKMPTQDPANASDFQIPFADAVMSLQKIPLKVKTKNIQKLEKKSKNLNM